MSTSPRLRDSGNDLLDRVSADEFSLLKPLLQRISLPLKQIVSQNASNVTHILFPTTSLVSLLAVLEDDDPVETATVGREGFVGVSAAMGVESSPHRVMCQGDGEALRVPVPAFLEAMGRAPGLTRLVHHYVAYSLHTAGQGIACNALHQIEARACRWLLLVHDQVGRDDFPMTHEFMAFMLGVRRQSVTVVAGALQSAGLISYHRGTITIRDRERLEEAACECYAAIRGYYQRAMF